MILKKGKSKIIKPSSRIRKRNNTRKYIAFSLKVAIALFVLIAPILVLRADFLQIKNVSINPGEIRDKTEVEKTAADFISGKVWAIFPKANLFLLDKSDLASLLLSDFPNLETVEVNKKLDKTLEINVKERSSDFIWCRDNNDCFNMTENGLVFSHSAVATRDREKLVFKGVISGDPIMKEFATREEMQKYLSLAQALQNGGLEVSAVDVEAQNKIVAETSLGDIFFNGEDKDLAPAIESALILIRDIQSKTPSVRFQYIDARFGNKVFYKTN